MVSWFGCVVAIVLKTGADRAGARVNVAVAAVGLTNAPIKPRMSTG